jgi:hypothetical protein
MITGLSLRRTAFALREISRTTIFARSSTRSWRADRIGRKYARISFRSGSKKLENVLAFIDTGADLTIISTKIAKKLKIKSSNIERKWTASDGDEKQSPITELELRSNDDEASVHLDEVLIEDSPIDKDSGEEVILGLDYLQKTRKVLRFDD